MEGGKTHNKCSFDKTAVKGTKTNTSAPKIDMHSFIKIVLGGLKFDKDLECLGVGGDRDGQITGVGVSGDLITVRHCGHTATD